MDKVSDERYEDIPITCPDCEFITSFAEDESNRWNLCFCTSHSTGHAPDYEEEFPDCKFIVEYKKYTRMYLDLDEVIRPTSVYCLDKRDMLCLRIVRSKNLISKCLYNKITYIDKRRKGFIGE